MQRTLLVADDLSGAADSAAAAAAAGLNTLVLLEVGSLSDHAEVLAIDADTRRLRPAEAKAQTARVVQTYYRPGQTVFKKLDSTLRGNIGAELSAVLDAVNSASGPDAGTAIAVLAPAFPATGRTTRNGVQLLNGVSLEATSIWQREGMTGRAHIPEMLQACHLRPSKIGLDAIRRGEPTLSALMRELAQRCDVLVCDAESDDDLRAVAASSALLGRSTVWAGSAGLARCLFGSEHLLRKSSPTDRRKLPSIAKPILFVAGTAADLSRRQIWELTSNAGVSKVEVSPAALRSGNYAGALRQYNASLSAALSAGQDTVLALGGSPDTEIELRLEDGRHLCGLLAELVAPQADYLGALVLTGGETARAVLERLRVQGLWMIGELEPGVPVSLAQGSGIPVVTKAGAFGDEATLHRCRVALRST
jgi:4-hydroxythreonine-4-phosphate dehydrogenase